MTPIGHILHMPYGKTPAGYIPLISGGSYDPIAYPALDKYITDNGGVSGTLPTIGGSHTGSIFIKSHDFSRVPGAFSTDAIEQRIQENTAKINQIPGLRTAMPPPDAYLPLISDLRMREGIGEPDRIDVSDAQDGSQMVPISTVSAEFSRASTATYVDKSGVLRTAAVDEPRFEKDGILVEGESTNLVRYSNDFSNAAWIARGNTSKADGDTFLGNPSARITSTTNVGGGSNNDYRQGISGFTAGADITISFWAKRISGERRVSVILGGISASLEITDVWDRYVIQGTTLNTQHSVFFVSGQASTIVFDLACVQVELQIFPTSYIPTSGTAVTRAAESLSIKGDNLSLQDYTLALRGSFPKADDASLYQQRWPTGTDDNIRYLKYNNGGLEMRDLGAFNRDIGDFNNGMFVTAAGSTVKSYVDGSQVGSTEKPSTTSVIPSENIYLGSNRGTADFLNGHIRDVRIWNRILPIEQIRDIA